MLFPLSKRPPVNDTLRNNSSIFCHPCVHLRHQALEQISRKTWQNPPVARYNVQPTRWLKIPDEEAIQSNGEIEAMGREVEEINPLKRKIFARRCLGNKSDIL